MEEEEEEEEDKEEEEEEDKEDVCRLPSGPVTNTSLSKETGLMFFFIRLANIIARVVFFRVLFLPPTNADVRARTFLFCDFLRGGSDFFGGFSLCSCSCGCGCACSSCIVGRGSTFSRRGGSTVDGLRARGTCSGTPETSGFSIAIASGSVCGGDSVMAGSYTSNTS